MPIFIRLLSVKIIAISMMITAIEKRKKINVVGSIPFSVNVLTNIPVDPNIIPARIGKSKYIFFIVPHFFISFNYFVSFV